MSKSVELDATFGILYVAALLSALLSGSTLQWVVSQGLFKRSWMNRDNQYNVLVFVATLTSLIQTVTCFINTIIAPVRPFSSRFCVLLANGVSV